MTRLFLNCRIIEQAKALTEASQQQKTEFVGLETQLRQLQAAVAQAHNEQRAVCRDFFFCPPDLTSFAIWDER